MGGTSASDVLLDNFSNSTVVIAAFAVFICLAVVDLASNIYLRLVPAQVLSGAEAVAISWRSDDVLDNIASFKTDTAAHVSAVSWD